MKKLLMLAAFLPLVGCGPSKAELEHQAKEKGVTVDSLLKSLEHTYYPDYASCINRANVDGCQYLLFGESIIHQANCNNPIHQIQN